VYARSLLGRVANTPGPSDSVSTIADAIDEASELVSVAQDSRHGGRPHYYRRLGGMRRKALEDFSKKSLRYTNEFLKDGKLYFTVNAEAYPTEFS